MKILCTRTRPLCIQTQSIQIRRVNRSNHDQTRKRASLTIAVNRKKKNLKLKIRFRTH